MILEMSQIGAVPDYDAVALIGDDALQEYFGTTKPTAEDVEDCDELFEEIDRGQGVYFVVYENEEPSQIFFAGYSYD